jgi:CMP/dCMP kinase
VCSVLRHFGGLHSQDTAAEKDGLLHEKEQERQCTLPLRFELIPIQLTMKKIVIAIDGYSSCGKSTTAKLVAAELGYAYIDTGAMYRAVTLYVLDHHVSLTNPKEVKDALDNIDITFHYNPKAKRNEVFLNGLNVEDEIRKMYISNQVSEVSVVKEVRRAMVAQQQKMGKKRGVVMDGRDIGTAVFPDAEVKIFMTADVDTRARRRQDELLEKKQLVNLGEIKENLQKRDLIDSTRTESPLRRADDAFLLDTSHMTIDEQVEFVLNKVTSRIFNGDYALQE